MSDENKATDLDKRSLEQITRVEELQNQLQKELVALLAHPLVPQEFKEVFEKKE